MTYPRVNARVAELFDECLDCLDAHSALRGKAHNRPGSEFGTSTDLLADQVPNTVLGSQQSSALGTLVVLDLRDRKHPCLDDARFPLDFQAPVKEVLY
jgi:hypothetical protein